jgi:hypothetical protein
MMADSVAVRFVIRTALDFKVAHRGSVDDRAADDQTGFSLRCLLLEQSWSLRRIFALFVLF